MTVRVDNAATGFTPAASRERTILKQEPKLVGIQYLRGIAALMVVCYHICAQTLTYDGMRNYHGIFDVWKLVSGIDLFFVISGFVMWVTSQHRTPGEFVWRRLVRIVPLYWLLTGLIVVLALIAPATFRVTHVSVMTTVKSLFFIPYANADGDFFPILAPGWTLNYEMFFYALFSLALFTRHRLIWVGLALASLIVVGWSKPSFYTNPMIAEFWCGMFIGYAYDRGWLRKIPLALAVGLIAGGLAGLLTPVWGNTRAVYLLSPMAIVMGSVAIEQVHGLRRIEWPALLGDASYSLYLTHLYVLRVLHILWVRLFPDNPWSFAAVAMVIVSLVAVGVFRTVETPMLAWFKRASRPKMATSLDAAG
jgi:exopolysaccharide production protein ExoZ